MHHRGRRVWAVLLALVLAAGAAACTDESPPQGTPPENVRYTYDTELPVLPEWSFQDWVTYGDVLVLVTVTAEDPATPTRELVRAGFVRRTVTARIDDTVWQRPTLRGDPSLPDTLQLSGSGWSWPHPRKNPEPEEPAVLAMAWPWMSVGSQYLVVLTMFNWHWVSPSEPDTVAPLPMGTLALDRGRVVPDDPHFGGPHFTLAGLSVDEVADAFDAQPVDPNAVPFMGLDPVQRRAKATDG